MYTFNKEIEEKLLADLHNFHNTGISYMLGDITLKHKKSYISHNFSVDFDNSLTQLFSFAISLLDGNCFPCMINDDEQKNAFAEKRYGIPVIGLHLPLVAECMSLAHSYAMYDDLFAMERPIIRYDYRYHPPQIDEYGNITFETAKNKNNFLFADMVSYLSVKFVILHEIAHHNFKHLEKTTNGKLHEIGNANSVHEGVSLQELELEADFWASARLLLDYSDIRRSFVRYYSKEITHLDTIRVLYLSMIIPLLTVNDPITPENMIFVSHPPSIIRYNDIKGVFASAFGINKSLRNRYWSFIKNELLNEYEQYEWLKEDLNELLDKYDIPWRNIDVISKVKNNNADYVNAFIMNWMNDIFARFILRFIDMNGIWYQDMVKNYEDFIAKINELSSNGIRLGKTYFVDVSQSM